jgi:ABC-type oligopeptide transport system substrate-binding subunit
MRKKIIFLSLFFVGSVLLSGCGGGGGSSTSSDNTVQERAISHIYEYAQHNSSAPTVQDYINAGVSGVTQENLDEVNSVVAGLTKEKVDTKEEIQAIVNSLQIN